MFISPVPQFDRPQFLRVIGLEARSIGDGRRHANGRACPGEGETTCLQGPSLEVANLRGAAEDAFPSGSVGVWRTGATHI